MDILSMNAFFTPSMFSPLLNKNTSPFLLPALQFIIITVLHLLGCWKKAKGQNLFQYGKERDQRPVIDIFNLWCNENLWLLVLGIIFQFNCQYTIPESSYLVVSADGCTPW